MWFYIEINGGYKKNKKKKKQEKTLLWKLKAWSIGFIVKYFLNNNLN